MFLIMVSGRFFIFFVLLFFIFHHVLSLISDHERLRLRDEVRDMFIHSYDAYMKYAYPADELMPLSCRGRYRGVEPCRGDVDDAMGNFSLTLIDTLDTIAMLGNYSEFERAIRLVINDVTFDSDIIVSVFETNIRVLGGLLSAHVLALRLKQKYPKQILQWYDDQLLRQAKDLGHRLLAAFNSSTGIPHPRVNLRHGLNSSKLGSLRETCTSCAGTMILEFAALSRLTDEPIFETKARKAMDYLWNQRHRQSDLVGNIINIDTGDWIRKESGVGAGIDSYYEYCLKAYILLGDESYLDRFNRHYAGIMKYVSHGPFLIDVHMHRPHNQAKNFMDSLLAFWPGLQVLKGDLKPAIETHEVLYQVTRRHNFLPEAFTTDFGIHWPHHPLRPEFIESTYFLYLATNDEHYLRVGKDVLRNLQNYTRTHCGYAAVTDVRTKKKEDRMDSFFLAETLKYLYLLFSKPNEIDFNLDEFVFTTEAHLLPLSLAYTRHDRNKTVARRRNYLPKTESDYRCPSAKQFFKSSSPNLDNLSYYRLLRSNVKDFVSNRACPSPTTSNHRQKSSSSSSTSSSKARQPPRLRAAQFSASKPEHIALLKQLGINVIILKDGRVQLIHNSASAHSLEAAEEGAFFMQEMISLSQQQKKSEQRLRTVSFVLPNDIKISLLAGPAQFGPEFTSHDDHVEAQVVKMIPFDGCNGSEMNTDEIRNRIAMVRRGNCMFIEKARTVQKLGAIGMIVVDDTENSSSKNMPMFSMSGDGSEDIVIASVFLYSEDAKILFNATEEYPDMLVKLDVFVEEEELPADTETYNDGSLKTDDQQPPPAASLSEDLANLFGMFHTQKLQFNEAREMFASMLNNFAMKISSGEKNVLRKSIKERRKKNLNGRFRCQANNLVQYLTSCPVK